MSKKKKHNRDLKEPETETAPEEIKTEDKAEEAPTAEETPATEEAPVAEETPATEEAPTAEEIPAAEGTPAAEEIPATEEAPAAEETPATEEATSAEETPATEEATSAEEASENSDASEETEEDNRVYELKEEKNPELEPVIVERNPDATIQFSKSIEREKKIASEVRRRRRRPIVFVLCLCVLLVLTAIVVNAIDSGEFRLPNYGKANPTPGTPSNVQAASLPVPTAPPATEAPAVTEEPVKESVYNIILSDMSWEAAKQDCIAKGGHLATISSYEELVKITDMAEQQGVYNLWIGCARVDGELTWENGEDIDFYVWSYGEPSYYDGFDGADENYVMLWYFDGTWCYNDSRNDPVGDYPDAYRGRLAYVIETEG